MLEDRVEDRPDGLARDGRLVGLADLAEDLPLAQHQALQAGRDPEQVADGPLVVVARPGAPAKRLGRHAVEAGEEVGQAVGLGRRAVGLAGGVDLDPVAGREDRRTRCRGRSAARASSPSARLAAVEGQGLADRGGRRAVIDPQGQQLHGALPAGRPAARAVGRGQVEHLDADPGEDQERERHDRQHHHAPPPHRRPEPGVQAGPRRPATSPGADDLRVGPASAATPAAARRAARLRTTPISRPNVSSGKASVIAPRFSRSDCSRLGSANPNRGGRLCLSRLRLDQVHQPGGERHAGADRPGQQEDPVHRPPERRRARPSSAPVRRRAARTSPPTTTRASTSGSTNTPTATGLGDRTIRYSPISATIHDSTSSDSKLMFGFAVDTPATDVRPFDADRFVDPQVRDAFIARLHSATRRRAD